MSTWKRDAASGLIVLVPVLVIVLIANWLFTRIAELPLVERITPIWLRVVIALVVFVSLVFAVGYLMRTTVGRLFESYLDAAMNRVPLVRVLYNASKLAVETALTGTEDLQTPVRLETWPGIRMTAFKTGKRTDDGREVLFLPTAPNITTGFVMEVDPADIEETDERVEEALTRILSAGFAEESDPGVRIDVTEGDGSGSPGNTEGE
jgi:uncharacterized membrane protein